MLSVFGFLIMLGPLVIVHEFGHYFFARLFKVKAEVFSVGFGPTIFNKKIGETDWRVSAIPLGGYVKLLGEEPDRVLTAEEERRALHKQAPYKRFFIFLGGPLFNFVFAVIIFMGILVIGERVPASVVGRVVQGSAAEQVGFRSGDRITAVDGASVRRFDEVAEKIHDSPGRKLRFDVVRSDAAAPLLIEAVPQVERGYSVYGETTEVGEIDGMFSPPRGLEVGVSNPDSVVGKAGVRTGDRLVAVNGASLKDWEQFEREFSSALVGTTFALKFEGAEKRSIETQVAKTAATREPGAIWGLYSSELFVEKAVGGAPAEAAGIKPGVRMVSVGGKQVRSFFELKDAVQASGEKTGKVVIEWEDAGKLTKAEITPTATHGRDATLKKTTQYTVGIVPRLTWAEPATVVERVLNPFTLVYKATERMAVFSWRNLVSLQKMLTGSVSVGTLGGPILIGKIAGESLTRGLNAFFATMAVLSVGLGVLNILPVPVLDGGHMLLLGLEIIRGKPLTLRQMEVIQQVGLSLIVLLMVVVIKNDISRLAFLN